MKGHANNETCKAGEKFQEKDREAKQQSSKRWNGILYTQAAVEKTFATQAEEGANRRLVPKWPASSSSLARTMQMPLLSPHVDLWLQF